jgi:hypothetical protein
MKHAGNRANVVLALVFIAMSFFVLVMWLSRPKHAGGDYGLRIRAGMHRQ